MLSTIRDLVRYDAWADVQHLHVLFIYEKAYADEAIRRKLEHIHATQRAFRAWLRGETADWGRLGSPFATPEELAVSFREYHNATLNESSAWTEEWLSEKLPIQYFENNKPSRGEALLQVVLHGQAHRAQNATRMRELAWNPPKKD